LFKEYYRNPEKTSEAWHDGYYHCGDTAWIDEDGYFHFVGRKDDIIKSSGYRIGPYEVESAVISHPSVLECAITGFPDPVRGQIVKATIVLAKGFEASDDLAKEIQNHVKKVTAPYKYPRKIVFVDALPTTINGKIQRKVIRNQDNS
jgi:acetyl-CoA synthetase